MSFVLTGFRQDQSVRQFMFDRICEDRTRSPYTVGADLGLIRKYRIAVQELPLLCLHFLEQRFADSEDHSLEFSEGDMLAYATTREAERKDATARKRKSHH